MFSSNIKPDFNRFLQVIDNKKSPILPLYEHNVCYEVIAKLTNSNLVELMHEKKLDEGFQIYSNFFAQVGYDIIPFEQCITDFMPIKGALCGGQGEIQSADDIKDFNWDKMLDIYYDNAAPQFEAFSKSIPYGMKGVGGVGNGVFEISENMVGLEYLPFLQFDDEVAYCDLYKRIGEMMYKIWDRMLNEFGEAYCVCRFGDDLGFKSSLLTMPATIRENILPIYKEIVKLVHNYDKKFILHSCGCIFEVMDDIINCDIDAKHSNEDAIAPFEYWIDKYSSQIALLGGIDMDFIVSSRPEQIKNFIIEKAELFYTKANGYAIGTGNSIPNYVPAENYLAMLEAVNEIREKQNKELSL